MSGFGKAKYGNSSETNYQKFIRLESDKELMVRVLPPMKSLADVGKWAMYHSVHYGYRGVDRKDPSKSSARPFRCVEQKNFKTGMITQSCPECLEIQRKKETLEERELSLSKRTDMSAEEKDIILSPLKSFLKEHNVDRKWYLNVMVSDGSFAVLQISHRLKKQLDLLVERVSNEEGVDPFDLNTGVWFNFRRTGKKLEAVDTVEPVYIKEEMNGRKVNVLKVSALTEAQIQDALTKCPDLTEVTRVISLDQINLLVGSSGDPEEVDRILAMGSVRAMERSASARERSAAPAVVKNTVVATPTATVTATTSTAEEDEQALLAKLEAVRAKKAAATVVAATNKVATTETANVTPKVNKVELGLPEDKFLELFES